MKKFALHIVGSTLAFAALPALSASMTMNGKMMDTNRDGMISKEEFMTYHEAMFDRMKKNANGMVMMKDMRIMPNSAMNNKGMTKDGSMMKQGGMMKDGAMMKDSAMMKDGAMMKDSAMMKPGMNKDGTMMKDTGMKDGGIKDGGMKDVPGTKSKPAPN